MCRWANLDSFGDDVASYFAAHHDGWRFYPRMNVGVLTDYQMSHRDNFAFQLTITDGGALEDDITDDA